MVHDDAAEYGVEKARARLKELREDAELTEDERAELEPINEHVAAAREQAEANAAAEDPTSPVEALLRGEPVRVRWPCTKRDCPGHPHPDLWCAPAPEARSTSEPLVRIWHCNKLDCPGHLAQEHTCSGAQPMRPPSPPIFGTWESEETLKRAVHGLRRQARMWKDRAIKGENLLTALRGRNETAVLKAREEQQREAEARFQRDMQNAATTILKAGMDLIKCNDRIRELERRQEQQAKHVVELVDARAALLAERDELQRQLNGIRDALAVAL